MSARPKFGGRALSKCALGRNTPLEDKNSECTVHVRLKEPFSSWRMDHKDIKKAAKTMQAAEGKEGEKQRCDFAVYQAENPHDKMSHLVLVECKRTYKGEDTMEEALSQLGDGLRVLRHMAGADNFGFDLLHLELVCKHMDNYVNPVTSGDETAFAHQNPIEYNGRKARIRVKYSVAEISDKSVAVKNAKGKG